MDEILRERLVQVEHDNKVCTQDRRDLWGEVNAVRLLGPKLDDMEDTLKEIKGLCLGQQLRLVELETKDAISKAQHNIIIGTAGIVAAGIGGFAAWLIKDVLWPLFFTHR